MTSFQLRFFSCILNVVVSAVRGPRKFQRSDSSDGAFLSFDITDTSGTIRGVMFDNEIQKYSALFGEGQKVKITSPVVASKNERYSTGYFLDTEIRIVGTSDVTISSRQLTFSDNSV